jgi:hypothetical protein
MGNSKPFIVALAITVLIGLIAVHAVVDWKYYDGHSDDIVLGNESGVVTGCEDSDGGINYRTGGFVSVETSSWIHFPRWNSILDEITDQGGSSIRIYDICTVPGVDGILEEYYCSGINNGNLIFPIRRTVACDICISSIDGDFCASGLSLNPPRKNPDDPRWRWFHYLEKNSELVLGIGEETIDDLKNARQCEENRDGKRILPPQTRHQESQSDASGWITYVVDGSEKKFADQCLPDGRIIKAHCLSGRNSIAIEPIICPDGCFTGDDGIGRCTGSEETGRYEDELQKDDERKRSRK